MQRLKPPDSYFNCCMLCLSFWCKIRLNSTTNMLSVCGKNPQHSQCGSRLAHPNTMRKLTALWEWGISRCSTDHHCPQHALKQHGTAFAPGPAHLLLRSTLFQVSFVVAGRELRPGSPWPGALPDGCSRHECLWLGTDRGQRGAE